MELDAKQLNLEMCTRADGMKISSLIHSIDFLVNMKMSRSSS